MVDPFELPKIRKRRDLSDAGEKAYSKYDDGTKEAAATINGQKTGINSDADIERAIMDMAGIKGITAKYPEDIKTFARGADAEFQAIEIKGMKPEDVKTLVDGLKNKHGMEVIHKHDDQTGLDTIVLITSEMTQKLLPKMKEEFEKLGKENPDLIRSMQKDSKSKEPDFKSPKEQVQDGKGKPAEAVKAGGLVEGAKIEVFAAAVSDKADGKGADLIRGNAEFVITKNADGKLIADLEGKGKQHLVPRPLIDGGKVTETATQEITATLKVDGKSKKVTFEVAKDGTLTEKAPPATPQGAAKPAEPMR